MINVVKNLQSSIKGVIQKLIGKKDISDALHIMPTVSNAMKDAIELGCYV